MEKVVGLSSVPILTGFLRTANPMSTSTLSFTSSQAPWLILRENFNVPLAPKSVVADSDEKEKGSSHNASIVRFISANPIQHALLPHRYNHRLRVISRLY